MPVMPGMRVSVQPTDEAAGPDGRRLRGNATARPGAQPTLAVKVPPWSSLSWPPPHRSGTAIEP